MVLATSPSWPSATTMSDGPNRKVGQEAPLDDLIAAPLLQDLHVTCSLP